MPNYLAILADVSQITFNLVTAFAVIFAVFKYFLISGDHIKYTEIAINPRLIAQLAEYNIIEVEINIENKGTQLLKLFNVFLFAKSTHPASDSWNWRSGNFISADDEKIWLNAGTSIKVTTLLEVPSSVQVLEIELVVPYLEQRSPISLTGVEVAKISDYNSATKFFSPLMLK